MRTLTLALAAAGLLAACSPKTETAAPAPVEGPAVSTSETPRNDAVDASSTAADTTLTPGANSFTEAQARAAIEGAGYTGVGALTQNEQGVWQATGTKDGAAATVSVDYKGVVSAK